MTTKKTRRFEPHPDTPQARLKLIRAVMEASTQEAEHKAVEALRDSLKKELDRAQ